MKRILLVMGIIIMLTATLVVLSGCGKKTKGVVGQWAYSSYVYTFNSDKTGTYNVMNNEMKFTYEDDGKKLSILYDGNTTPLVLNYRLEGDKLYISDSFGNEIEYTKK